MHMAPPLAHGTRGFVLLPPYTVLFCSPHSFAPKDIRKGDWEMICWFGWKRRDSWGWDGVNVDLGWESELENQARMRIGVDLDEQVLLLSSVLLGKKCSSFVLMCLQVPSRNRIPNCSLFSWHALRFILWRPYFWKTELLEPSCRLGPNSQPTVTPNNLIPMSALLYEVKTLVFTRWPKSSCTCVIGVLI